MGDANTSNMEQHQLGQSPLSPPAVSPAPTTISEPQLTPLSPTSADRVFPIRSIINVEQRHAYKSLATPAEEYTGFRIGPDSGLASRRVGARIQSVGSNSGSGETRETDMQRGRDEPDHQQPSSSRKDQSLPRGRIDSMGSRRASLSSEPDISVQRSTPQVLNEGLSGAQQHASEGTASVDDSRSIKSRASSFKSEKHPMQVEPDQNFVTARFKHVVTEGGHAIITGRGGETLQRCEDEPIHIPGAVQSFGLLIALREEEERLVVRIVSENSKEIIGFTPRQLFELDSFLEILSEEQGDNLLDHLDFIRDDEANVEVNGPEVFLMSLRTPQKKLVKLWCAMHVQPANEGLIICEFELEDDQINPLVPTDEQTPEPPEDTLGSNPTQEELEQSTVNLSKPLRVLRSARKKKGEAAAMEVFNIMSQVQEQLSSAPNLEVFLKVLIGVIKELTGFHRVMVYQFDQSWNGRVVAELLDPRATRDLYNGLHFPASDIPKQARDLYRLNKVRLLYDREQQTARLVCRTLEDMEKPLDLTFSYLRAMSPIHVKYLRNMAVRGSMSVSITVFNELWGLISCHSYGSKGMRVSFPIRKMCRLVGDTASRNIERLSYAARLHARKLINTAPTESNPSGYIVASSDDLLKLFDADCGALSIRDETKLLGRIPQTQEVLALLEYLRMKDFRNVFASQDICKDFQDLHYPPGFSFLAGILYVPLSASGGDFIVLIRKGQLREVKWAGNPYEKYLREGTEGYLEPRKSFKMWRETVLGRCKDWTEEEVETGSVLSLVYGKFIEVWRQKEMAMQNTQLTKLLLANSAHEVRTPLNAIINYLEIALEGSLDQETRENLARSHSASKSLIYVINDLLDLTKMEEGQDLVRDDAFDLSTTLREATDMFTKDAQRKQLVYNIHEYPGLPTVVVGDQRRVRQIISNLIANAIQNTSSGSITVEAWIPVQNQTPGKVEVEFAVQDTGAGMSESKVEALFRDLEQVTGEDEELPIGDKQIEVAETKKSTLGLGLALVARCIKNMDGQLRLKSEEGKGSRFVIQLCFNLPEEQRYTKEITGETTAEDLPASDEVPATPPATEGGIMLIERTFEKTEPFPLSRQHSIDTVKSQGSLDSYKSQGSLKSLKSQSSGKSDVDRLIDAIQEPYILNKGDGGDLEKRRNSCGSAYVPNGSPACSSRSSIRSNMTSIPGQETVMDSRQPIRAVRIPDEQDLTPIARESPRRTHQKVLFNVEGTMNNEPSRRKGSPECLRILVAEDDPINSKILNKRLEKLGHQVYLTVNGEECAGAHAEKSNIFDVVLMDIQMPIVDGLTSTKMIRSFEKCHSLDLLSNSAGANGRLPIFAVSASLVEKDVQVYKDIGFDGWILKPVDFKRLSELFRGIYDGDARNNAVYRPGQWEHGGWFTSKQKQEKQEVDMDSSSESTPVAQPMADA